jgi:tyrosine-protein kinase Etk/Wzc
MSQNTTAIQAVAQHHAMVNQPISQPAPAMQQYEDEIELSSYLDIVSDSRAIIFKTTLLCLLLGLAYAFLAKPVYEATMLIHVEEDKPNNSKNMIGEISSLFDVKAAAISEMELIKSRMVIAKSVDNLGLYIDAEPHYFPVIGRIIASHHAGLSKPGILGYGGYVWGQEKIDIADFFVPDALHNAPFVVTAMAAQQFRVQQEKYGIDFTGKVDVPTSLQLAQGKLSLRVNRLDALPGAQFELRYQPKLAAIEKVQKAMTVAEIGKQSGLIGVTMEGDDAKSAHDTLAEIGREYIHQNVTRKLEEAEKSLAFLDKQLPDVKQKLDNSETEYYKFRNNNGTIDLGEESKISLQQAAAAKAKRLDLQQKREELLVSFTPNHPVVQSIDKQIRDMSNEVGRANDHIRQLPVLEHDLLRLSRDVKVNTELYSALLNSAQQLRLVKAGKVSNVRLIDLPMMPEKPARPNQGKIIGLAAAAGLCLGLALAFLRRMLNKGIETPRKIEQMLGARVVYACVPHSTTQRQLCKGTPKRARNIPLLARAEPGDPAIESLRSFRTSLQIAMPRYRNNIVQISGPTVGLGKSFISANFAAVLAASGKRVLLIDADFRAGHLHQYFDVERERGLSEVIAASVPPQQAIHHNVVERLDFLSTGRLPPNPSEFLLHPNFGALLQTLSLEYDCVLVDPPALLAVSDALIIGAHAGAVFILARANVTTDEDINESIKRMNQAGIAPQGIVFNDMKVRPRQLNNYSYGR